MAAHRADSWIVTFTASAKAEAVTKQILPHKPARQALALRTQVIMPQSIGTSKQRRSRDLRELDEARVM